MQVSFTNEDLLLYIYNELNQFQRAAIELELVENAELQAEYLEILETVNMLNSVSLNPNPTSMEIIMEHSHHGEELFH